jgi:hypothetical protein
VAGVLHVHEVRTDADVADGEAGAGDDLARLELALEVVEQGRDVVVERLVVLGRDVERQERPELIVEALFRERDAHLAHER